MHMTTAVLYFPSGRGLGHFGGRDDVIYWKCDEGQMLEEVLTIPMTNIRREEALITAAHQQMTEMEYERRRVTGTLNSSTITTKAIDLLTVGRKPQTTKQPKVCTSLNATSITVVPFCSLYQCNIQARHHRGTKFKVTLDSEYFNCPPYILMPHPSNQSKAASSKQAATEGERVINYLNISSVMLELSFLVIRVKK